MLLKRRNANTDLMLTKADKNKLDAMLNQTININHLKRIIFAITI